MNWWIDENINGLIDGFINRYMSGSINFYHDDDMTNVIL